MSPKIAESNMGVKKCVDCGTVWTFRELKSCVFCGGASVDEAPLPPAETPRPGTLSMQAAGRPARKSPAAAVASAVGTSTPPSRPTPTRPSPEPPPPTPTPPPRPPAPQTVRAPSPFLPFALGLTALVLCGFVPMVAGIQSYQMFGLFGLLGAGLLTPLAPMAWFTGVSYESRCAKLGVAPVATARLGKMLGIVGTILVIFQLAALTYTVAASRSGF